MRYLTVLSAVLFVSLSSWPTAAQAGNDIITNGDFSSGATGWSELGADDKHIAEVTKLPDGTPVLHLARLVEKADARGVQFNLKFKPQTLYRLAVTVRGTAPCQVSLRPSSATDPRYFELCRSWATSAAPLDVTAALVTREFWFDSGLKAQTAFLALGVGGEASGEVFVSRAALTEERSTAPDPAETVIAHIGDSITATSYLPFDRRIDVLLDAMCLKEFPARRICNINFGVDGESVIELLDSGRYQSAMKEHLAKIDIAVIQYGANDRRKYDAVEFKKRLGAFCDKLAADYPGIRFVIGTGPYMHGVDDSILKQYAPYWQASRDLAAERSLPLADVYKAFEAQHDIALTRKPGDIHPSVSGVQVRAECEFAALRVLLAAPTQHNP
jgi:lysophospholipase L1-like esterase